MHQGSLLITAILNQNEKRVKLLLDQKADPNDKDGEYGIPLFMALRYGTSANIVESLILAKADIQHQHIFMDKPVSFLMCARDFIGCICASKANVLLHYGSRFSEVEKEEAKLLVVGEQHLLAAHDIMRERVARCRRLCIALWAAPFQQRDLKVWWIRELVWSTRHDAVWTPDLPMPEGYT